MRRSLRSQKRELFRKQRIERAINNIEKYGYYGKKSKIGNKITLMVIILFMFLGLILFRQNNISYIDMSEEDFYNKYESFILTNSEKFLYGKKIINKLKKEQEIALIQESTINSKNFIALNLKNDNIKTVAVIGKVSESKIFLDSFSENVIVINALLNKVDYINSLKILKDTGILNNDNRVIFSNKVIKLKSENLRYTVLNKDDKVIFSIEK